MKNNDEDKSSQPNKHEQDPITKPRKRKRSRPGQLKVGDESIIFSALDHIPEGNRQLYTSSLTSNNNESDRQETSLLSFFQNNSTGYPERVGQQQAQFSHLTMNPPFNTFNAPQVGVARTIHSFTGNDLLHHEQQLALLQQQQQRQQLQDFLLSSSRQTSMSGPIEAVTALPHELALLLQSKPSSLAELVSKIHPSSSNFQSQLQREQLARSNSTTVRGTIDHSSVLASIASSLLTSIHSSAALNARRDELSSLRIPPITNNNSYDRVSTPEITRSLQGNINTINSLDTTIDKNRLLMELLRRAEGQAALSTLPISHSTGIGDNYGTRSTLGFERDPKLSTMLPTIRGDALTASSQRAGGTGLASFGLIPPAAAVATPLEILSAAHARNELLSNLTLDRSGASNTLSISNAQPNSRTANPARRNSSSTDGNRPERSERRKLKRVELREKWTASISRRPSTLPCILYTETDEEYLTAYQCMLRKQLELFKATTDDIRCSSQQGRTTSIQAGQVGLRCRHCESGLALRTKGAVYYSRSIDGVYQIGQNIGKVHLSERCYRIPETTRQKLLALKNDSRRAASGKLYWSDCLRAVGVYEDGDILRFRTPESVAATSPDKDDDRKQMAARSPKKKSSGDTD